MRMTSLLLFPLFHQVSVQIMHLLCAARKRPLIVRCIIAPQMIVTAPTMEQSVIQPPKKKPTIRNFARRRLSFDPSAIDHEAARKSLEKSRQSTDRKRGLFGQSKSNANSNSEKPRGKRSMDLLRGTHSETPSERPSLNLPVPSARQSDSSRSDGSSTDHISFAASDTPPTRSRAANNNQSFFDKIRRKNNRASLFPLPVKIPPPNQYPDTAPATPRASTSAISSGSPTHSHGQHSPPQTAIHRPSGVSEDNVLTIPVNKPTQALAASSIALTGQLLRNDSTSSAHSVRSSPVAPRRLGLRGRSSTMGSVDTRPDEAPPTPPFAQSGFASSGRTSTSTAGRSSLSNLWGLGQRFRQNSEPHSPMFGSPSHGGGTPGISSHTNSMSISREALVLPKREDGEAPGRYLERLQEVVDRSMIASLMSKKDDPFSAGVLRSYMRKFAFFGEPLDMSIRKMLMEVELPKETQQIDRVLQSFADRYHECNPGIFANPEQAYFIAFSILILHTDFFNKNNKRKMQKPDYIKNTGSEGVAEDVLACFYDNIVYTPFVHIDEALDMEKMSGKKSKKNKLKTPINAMNDPGKKVLREPIDPYPLIFENRLDLLRPPIAEVMNLRDPYTYSGTAQDLDVRNLHGSFVRYGVLQIVSARSRPEAFMAQVTDNATSTEEEERAGVVEMPVTKVGILQRKEVKRKTARSPWQEWGVILTRSGLSFFKNAAWVRNLMHQYEAHVRQGHGTPVVFKPPISDFKADHIISMDGTVALMDTSYKNHKNAIATFSKGGVEEIFRAENESEMNDWLAKINYSAALETSGVRPRGLLGGVYEGQRNRGIRRLDSSHSTTTVQTPTGEVTISSGRIDRELAQQIAAARRELIQRKLKEAEEKLGDAVKSLANHERDARHILIVAPIQPKTRESIIHGAGRLAAKLKWVRIEIWRMKCHHDILMMDLEEERRRTKENEARVQRIMNESGSPSKSTPNGLTRINSKASGAVSSQKSQKSPQSPVVSTRTGKKSPTEPDNDDDVFKTPPEGSRQNSPGFPPGTWELPPLGASMGAPFSASPPSNLSQSPKTSPVFRPASVDQERDLHRGSISTIATSDRPKTPASAYTTPTGEEESVTAAPTAGATFDGTPTSAVARPQTATSESEPERTPQPGSPDSRNRDRVRRSLHRTLRDSQRSSHHGSHHGHQRSGKGKDSASTIVSDETAPTESEGLHRAKGSFTVHGKKASVITFGSDWGGMSAEEKLKLRRQAQSESEGGRAGSVAATSDGESYKSGSIGGGVGIVGPFTAWVGSDSSAGTINPNGAPATNGSDVARTLSMTSGSTTTGQSVRNREKESQTSLDAPPLLASMNDRSDLSNSETVAHASDSNNILKPQPKTSSLRSQRSNVSTENLAPPSRDRRPDSLKSISRSSLRSEKSTNGRISEESEDVVDVDDEKSNGKDEVKKDIVVEA
jgi:hypothetical protein